MSNSSFEHLDIPDQVCIDKTVEEFLRQKKEWGVEHDRGHSLNDWKLLITKFLDSLTSEEGKAENLRTWSKITALALSAQRAELDKRTK